MFRTHLCKSAMHRFFFLIFYFFKTAESHQSAASRSVLSSLIIAGVIEIKRGSRGGEVRAGRDTHEWRKIQTISTILKFQFSEAPRFSLAGPEGKKQTKKKDPAGAPFHLLLLRLLQFVADSHEKRLCGRRERGAK